MHIAIIGAGPIGLEAALAAIERGHSVSIYERGRVGENLRDWGHVRLFSPFGMNTSERGRGVLRAAGHELPVDDALLTGREFVDRYLVPLAMSSELAHCISERSEVLAIGRQTLGKRALVGRPERAEDGFRIRVRGELDDIDGEPDDFVFDRFEWAEVVLDCSGTYPNHRWLGAGGIPCRGERSRAELVEHRLPDVLGRERARYANRSTLVVGSGYSAATTVVALNELVATAPETRVTWVTRPDRDPPIPRIVGDGLEARDRLAEGANGVARVGGSIEWRNNWIIEAVGPYEGRTTVLVTSLWEGGKAGTGPVVFDNVVANVGYKPDRSLYEELQVHECYASQGPMRLAATLLGETSGDCLGMTSPGPESLRIPEPNFYILGAKSYGRDSRFLLRTGLQQVEDVMQLLGNGT